MIAITCQGCGASGEGAFCTACGQRRPRPGDFRLRHMLGEAWEAVSDVDSRLWRTLLGIFRPGLLTEAFLQYRWQQYLPPLRLYLIFSGIYFLLAWDVTFEINAAQLRAAPPDTLPPAVLAVFTDPAASALASDLTSVIKFLMVGAMAAWVAFLHRANRLPAGAHLAFAVHYTVADFALFSLTAPLLAWTPAPHQLAVLGATTQLGILALLAWATLAVRRVYRRGWPSSLWRGLMIVAADLVLSTLAGQVAILIVLLSRK